MRQVFHYKGFSLSADNIKKGHCSLSIALSWELFELEPKTQLKYITNKANIAEATLKIPPKIVGKPNIINVAPLSAPRYSHAPSLSPRTTKRNSPPKPSPKYIEFKNQTADQCLWSMGLFLAQKNPTAKSRKTTMLKTTSRSKRLLPSYAQCN